MEYSIEEALRELNEANKDWENFNNYLSSSSFDYTRYIDIFKNNKQRLKPEERDLYYWMKKSPDEFIQRMLELENTLSSSQEKRKAKDIGAEKIYEDDNFVVLKILNYGAAKLYGKNTKWCISGNNPEEVKGSYYFDQYLKNDYSAFYFVLSKHSDEKWCVCANRNNPKRIKDIWNALNDTVENIPGLPSIPEIGYEEDREEEFEIDD